MEKSGVRKFGVLIGTFLLVWLAFHYLFPIFLPFLLGWLLAAAVEPGVKFLQERLRFPRALAAAVSVTFGLILLSVLLVLLLALGYREVTALAQGLPGIMEELSGQIGRGRDWAVALVSRAPAGLADLLSRTVSDLFAGGSVLLEKAASWLISLAGSVMSWIPGGALLIGTAVISSYMISAQMPNLKRRILDSEIWKKRLQPGWQRLKEAVGGWFRAQVKLAGVTFGIVWVGFLLLRMSHSMLWALVTALVDAVPMLGTGTVLVPWAVYLFLKGETVRGVGLLGIYVTAMLTRSALEPKMVGRHLGLNPLLTLLALYAGFRIWGVVGMILSPVLAVTATQLASLGNGDLHQGGDVV